MQILNGNTHFRLFSILFSIYVFVVCRISFANSPKPQGILYIYYYINNYLYTSYIYYFIYYYTIIILLSYYVTL